MYTELVLGVDLVRDTPKEVIDILEFMISGEFEDPKPIVPDHPLFKTDRWRTMLQSDSYYFGEFGNSLIDAPRFKEDVYKLSIRSNLKNYDSEIELFLNWLSPYIETHGFIGYMRYEEYDNPWLIYHGDFEDDDIHLFTIATWEETTLDAKWLAEHGSEG